jgi:hypothetical protein
MNWERMKMVMRLPNRFHIQTITINAKHNFDSFEISVEIRELMKVYRILKKRGENKFCDKIKKLLNSYAQSYGYVKFNIDDNVSMKKIEVDDNDY